MAPPLRNLPLVLLLLASAASGDYLEELRKGSSAQATTDLVKLAEWCRSKKLYRSRVDLYELILEFDPDHPIARKKLRYVRGKDGNWERLRPMPETRDRKPKYRDELIERKKRIAVMYATPLLGLLRKSGATTSDATREKVYREIYLLDPDHKAARAANGEVHDGKRWILKETQRAAARRLVLRTRIRELLSGLPVGKAVAPTKEEQDYGLEWKATLQGSTWRLLSTVKPFEAVECLRVADATDGTFEAVFGIGGVEFAGRRILMTDDAKKYEQALEKAPHMTKEYREYSRLLSSTWLPRSRTCLCHKPFPEWRIEICARQPFVLLLDEYFELNVRHGWAFEGMGLYLTHALTGFRRSTFVRITRYADDEKNKPDQRLWGELLPTTADWFAIAAKRIEAGETPDWKLMLSKDVNQMTVNDLLFSFLLAAYLAEAQSDHLPGILKEVAENKPSAEVLQKMLGMPLSRIEQRVYRWIREHGPG